MIIINLKDLYASDSQSQLTDKANYNFNQLLRLGIGQPGVQGDPGVRGNQGIIGQPGVQGTRGSYWFSGNYVIPPAGTYNANDCYLTSALNYEIMWQYDGSAWQEIINLRDIITDAVNVSSPFMRISSSPIPGSWVTAILPLPIIGSGEWNNTLFMAAENQDKFYTTSETVFNGAKMSKSQTVFLTDSSLIMGAPSVPYSLMIGEVGYEYNVNTPDLNTPVIQINNTLRVSNRYTHTSGYPAISTGLFDMQSPDDGSKKSDTMTIMSFRTRYCNNPGNPTKTYGTTSVYFTTREAMMLSAPSTQDLSEILSTDFAGIFLENQRGTNRFSAIAIGTDSAATEISGTTNKAYIMTNDGIDKLFFNTSLVPFKITTNTVRNIGLSDDGTDALRHWDAAYLKSHIGYTDIADFKFWRKTNNTANWASDSANCVMTMTREGKVAIGKNLLDYTGIGMINGTHFGTAAYPGNANNRAVLHVYDDVIDAPTYYNLYEAGLIVEKRWGYKDTNTSLKMGAFIRNHSKITSSSPGSGQSPRLLGLRIEQQQESTDLTNGSMDLMIGLDVYQSTGASAAYVDEVIGVRSDMSVHATSAMIRTYKSVYANVPTYGISGSDSRSGGVYDAYGIYQGGSTAALNYFAGHLQFGGSGSGYTIPYSGITTTGHVISVWGSGGPGGNLTIVAGSHSGNTASDLCLYGGFAISSIGFTAIGGRAILAGGNGYSGGAVQIYGGTGTGTGTPPRGGAVTIRGGWTQSATTGFPGLVTITPGVSASVSGSLLLPYTAGNIAIGFHSDNLGNNYNIGNVGFGTHLPKEKIEVNGNISLSPRTGLSVTDPGEDHRRKIYVRPGRQDVIGYEQSVNGTNLLLQAGDGLGMGMQGGNLYVSGGARGSLGVDGNTIIGMGELPNNPNIYVALGKVGIRKEVNPFDTLINVDIAGNVRLDATSDIITMPAAAPGWQIATPPAGTNLGDATTWQWRPSRSGAFAGANSRANAESVIKYKIIGKTIIINMYFKIDKRDEASRIYLGSDSSNPTDATYGFCAYNQILLPASIGKIKLVNSTGFYGGCTIGFAQYTTTDTATTMYRTDLDASTVNYGSVDRIALAFASPATMIASPFYSTTYQSILGARIQYDGGWESIIYRGQVIAELE